jgi:hypothetical protein
MRAAATYLRILTRLTGAVQIALGLLFWSGNALSLVPIHMLVGLTLVVALWVLAGLAATSGASPGTVALAVAWGLVVPVLGLTQTQLLPGPDHWVVQVVHLLIGLGAIGQAERMAAEILGPSAPALGA